MSRASFALVVKDDPWEPARSRILPSQRQCSGYVNIFIHRILENPTQRRNDTYLPRFLASLHCRISASYFLGERLLAKNQGVGTPTGFVFQKNHSKMVIRAGIVIMARMHFLQISCLGPHPVSSCCLQKPVQQCAETECRSPSSAGESSARFQGKNYTIA